MSFLYLEGCKAEKNIRKSPSLIFSCRATFRKITALAAQFYRRLKETLDLSFLYEHTKELYGSTGNPSIDPVVFRSGGPVQVYAHQLAGEYYL